MGARGDNDDVAVRGEMGEEQVEEERVADVVDCKGLFDAGVEETDGPWELEACVHDEVGDWGIL